MAVLEIKPEELNIRRQARGWSREDLAEHSGVSYGRIAHLEGRQKSPIVYPATAGKLAKALRCKVEDITRVKKGSLRG